MKQSMLYAFLSLALPSLIIAEYGATNKFDNGFEEVSKSLLFFLLGLQSGRRKTTRIFFSKIFQKYLLLSTNLGTNKLSVRNSRIHYFLTTIKRHFPPFKGLSGAQSVTMTMEHLGVRGEG